MHFMNLQMKTSLGEAWPFLVPKPSIKASRQSPQRGGQRMEKQDPHQHLQRRPKCARSLASPSLPKKQVTDQPILQEVSLLNFIVSFTNLVLAGWFPICLSSGLLESVGLSLPHLPALQPQEETRGGFSIVQTPGAGVETNGAVLHIL